MQENEIQKPIDKFQEKNPFPKKRAGKMNKIQVGEISIASEEPLDKITKIALKLVKAKYGHIQTIVTYKPKSFFDELEEL